mmetsp:Transcript_4980/g.15159  ORF Transcript_4980/g.15159 Transcript_4980/m.15159 type:complete len:109 (-) Transcript_4980:2287-2613(-)
MYLNIKEGMRAQAVFSGRDIRLSICHTLVLWLASGVERLVGPSIGLAAHLDLVLLKRSSRAVSKPPWKVTNDQATGKEHGALARHAARRDCDAASRDHSLMLKASRTA